MRVRQVCQISCAFSSVTLVMVHGKSWSGEHGIEPFPFITGKLQLFGALLKFAGCRSAVTYMSTAKKQHIKLGKPDAEKVSKVSVSKGCRRRTRSKADRGAVVGAARVGPGDL